MPQQVRGSNSDPSKNVQGIVECEENSYIIDGFEEGDDSAFNQMILNDEKSFKNPVPNLNKINYKFDEQNRIHTFY